MKGSLLRQRLKPWMLPIAMAGGVLFHDCIEYVGFLTPYLIFVMLYVTFCKINFRHISVTRLMWALLAIQVVGAAIIYVAIAGVSRDVAQGLMICVLCPTATAAPVVTGMLGGNVARLITYSLMSNVTAALIAPLFLSVAGSVDVDILTSSGQICSHVAPLILGPLILAQITSRVAPKVHHAVADHQGLSFYLWAVSLLIVVGRSVSFILASPAGALPEIIVLAIGAGVVCVGQFAIGRRVGYRMGDRISGAQGLGQKNTVLAIWLALTYLNPISSVAPAAYIAWQNSINSWQLFHYQKAISRG